MQSELRQQQLMSSSEYSIQSEYCPLCHKSVEEECIKLNDSRWHSNCFYCQTCKKNLYETYDIEARMDPTNKKIYCKKCCPPNSIDGFVHVTQLEQYTFLLKFALKRLYIINMKSKFFFFFFFFFLIIIYYLSVYLNIHIFIYLFIYLFVFSFIYLFYLFIYYIFYIVIKLYI